MQALPAGKKKNLPLPDLAMLQACFILNEDGSLIWRHRPISHFPNPSIAKSWNLQHAGKKAGYMARYYFLVGLFGAKYVAHRIVFFMSTGIDPLENDIDHRDLDTSNNAPSNLRLATPSQNLHNTAIRKNNTSGVKGVCWDRANSTWRARILNNGKRHIARFNALEDAAEWIKIKRESLQGEFARHV